MELGVRGRARVLPASRSFLYTRLVVLSLADGPARAEVRSGSQRPRVERSWSRPGRGPRPARLRPPRRRAIRRPASLRPSLRQAPTGRLLATPAASASARIDLIRGARGEINTSAYIFGDDRVGRLALAELRAAAR